uniref:Protein FAR1-RELATED SEQUENCE n=1 Tax=Lactuca sativa TaxID=4236 RepID=A0A9R1XH74_LACSA|nr:hypothetical protein LSAT_V11C400219910 [Lactuca sativa]
MGYKDYYIAKNGKPGNTGVTDTIEQFEATWEDMCSKYQLESNCWISDMYNQRIHWAKPFLKDIFFASMTTTRGSDSINLFFDGFVNSSTMLNEFIQLSHEGPPKKMKTLSQGTRDWFFLHCIKSKQKHVNMFDSFKKEWTEAITNLTHENLRKNT